MVCVAVINLIMYSQSSFYYYVILVILFASTSAVEYKGDSFENKYSSQELFIPKGIALGKELSSNTAQVGSFQLQLTPSTPVATLDYGNEVAGYPFFNVVSVTGSVQIEIKYSEEFNGLLSNFSDGPIPFNIGLSNSYRVETFQVTKSGRFDEFLLQGGQRWQSIRLLTQGTIQFSSIGFVPSVSNVDISQVPGQFSCDDDRLNNIWRLGAKAASMSCFDQGSQKAIWQVNSTGTFLQGMRSGLSAKGASLKDYTLEFDAYIKRGGIGWVVAHPLASPAKGIQLNLIGNLPPATRFVNTNTSLTPANSIVLGYGYSIVNVTTLTSYHLDTFEIPFSIQENAWYKIQTVLTGGQHLAVSISGTQVFNISLASYYIGGSTIPTRGSFGFGGWQDQSGTIRNVIVFDTNNGTIIYSNSMTDSVSVIAEYGVHSNYAPICLDGPKRDRLAWLGDFYHTVRVIGASTTRYDFIRGTLSFFLDWQTPSGLLPYAIPISYSPSEAYSAFANGAGGQLFGYEVWGLILADYQILGLLSFTNYISISNDLDYARKTWPQWQLQIGWILRQVNSSTSLIDLGNTFLGPAKGGSAVNCALVQALKMSAQVATAINDTQSASQYLTSAMALAAAVNKNLWNPTLGVYSLALDSPTDYSVSACAFCITSGTASSDQAAAFLSAMENLRLGPGYKDSTKVNSTDITVNISPNTNGFLLAALLAQSPSVQRNSTSTKFVAKTSKDLLYSLWGAMLADKKTSTGASWEYVSVSGSPGLGLYTSLSHPWGGAPTYLLTEWVAGLRPAADLDGFGYRNWVVDPSVGIEMGLKRAAGSVVSGFGGSVDVEWEINDGKMLNIEIKAPVQTSGIFELGARRQVLSGKSRYSLNIEI
ncbi:glycoside hydrolase family 78 protein [Tricladium varicosporioides]|nr:glycoside hydrolase family 78 protein [Hymenoscyphus varicosporioides]